MTALVTQIDADALRAKIEKIRQIVAPDLDDQELQFYLEYCKKTGLDPITRQIYATKRRTKNAKGEWESKITIGTSIDGQRLVAQRTGDYEGQQGPFWCGADGRWVDVWLKDAPPSASKVGVLRRGFKEPVWGVAVFDSYVQLKQDGSPTSMWRKMPDVMIAKCAEALALRKAFPNELSGLYADEEMQQIDSPNPPESKPRKIQAQGTAQAAIAHKPNAEENNKLSQSSSGAVPGQTQGVVEQGSRQDGPPKTISGTPVQPSPAEEDKRPPTDEEVEKFKTFASKCNWEPAEITALMREKYGTIIYQRITLAQLRSLALHIGGNVRPFENLPTDWQPPLDDVDYTRTHGAP